MTTTKANLRLSVARRLRSLHTITTTTNGSSAKDTFIAAGLLDVFPTGLVNTYVYRPTTSEERRVVAYDANDQICAVDRAFGTQVMSGETLYIFHRVSPSDIDEAIKLAVEEVYPYLAQQIVDTSLTTSAQVYEYTIPSSIRDLERSLGARVELQDNPNVSTAPYRKLASWDTRRTRTTASQSYKLIIGPGDLVADRTIRLYGLGPLDFPSTDATTMPIDSPQTNLLVYYVLGLVYDMLAGYGDGDGAFAGQQAAKFRGLYDQYKDVWGIVIEPTTTKSNESSIDSLPLARRAEPS